MDVIDSIVIDSDEGGFELVLSGDFVQAFTDYLADGEATSVRLSLQSAAFEFASSPGLGHLAEWAADGRAIRREVNAAYKYPDEAYALDDPKHPTYYERMVGHAE